MFGPRSIPKAINTAPETIPPIRKLPSWHGRDDPAIALETHHPRRVDGQ
jgi:hypothetical protein